MTLDFLGAESGYRNSRDHVLDGQLLGVLQPFLRKKRAPLSMGLSYFRQHAVVDSRNQFSANVRVGSWLGRTLYHHCRWCDLDYELHNKPDLSIRF